MQIKLIFALGLVLNRGTRQDGNGLLVGADGLSLLFKVRPVLGGVLFKIKVSKVTTHPQEVEAHCCDCYLLYLESVSPSKINNAVKVATSA